MPCLVILRQILPSFISSGGLQSVISDIFGQIYSLSFDEMGGGSLQLREPEHNTGSLRMTCPCFWTDFVSLISGTISSPVLLNSISREVPPIVQVGGGAPDTDMVSSFKKGVPPHTDFAHSVLFCKVETNFVARGPALLPEQ